MRIAVTGANGFLGLHALRLLSETHEVLALSRRPIDSPRYAGLPVSITTYSSGELVSSFEQVDMVVHLAAERPANVSSGWSSNSSLDFRVFDAAHKAKVRAVIFSSSISVYGLSGAPWSEQSEARPSSVYGLQKFHSEMTGSFFTDRGLPVTILRLPSLFGAGERAGSAVSTFLEKAKSGGRIEISVKGMVREYLSVTDAASAIRAVSAAPVSGIFNVGSGECFSMYELAETVLKGFGRKDRPMLQEDARVSEGFSVMDSRKFKRQFSWEPGTILQAAHEIASEKGKV